MMTKNIKLQVKELSVGKNMTLVAIEGSLDAVTVPEAEKILDGLLSKENISILLDCIKLSYLNTMGLVLLLKYHIKAKRRGGVLKIFNLDKKIYEILDMSGALKLLEVFKNQEEAVNSIRA